MCLPTIITACASVRYFQRDWDERERISRTNPEGNTCQMEKSWKRWLFKTRSECIIVAVCVMDGLGVESCSSSRSSPSLRSLNLICSGSSQNIEQRRTDSSNSSEDSISPSPSNVIDCNRRFVSWTFFK